MVVLSVRYKFHTKTSEKREVSQDLQDCSLLMAIKHHCYTEFTVLLNLTVIIIMLPKGGFCMIAMIAAIIEEKKSSAIMLIIWKPLSSDCCDF